MEVQVDINEESKKVDKNGENKVDTNLKNKILWLAFKNDNKKKFLQLLELGANPEQLDDDVEDRDGYLEQTDGHSEQKDDNSEETGPDMEPTFANLEQKDDKDVNLSIFERLCKFDNASNYLLMCLDCKTDPNRENPYNGYHPIHHAVQNLAVENIKILLKADADCANQTIYFDKTPLHLLTEVLSDNNLRRVFNIIRIFSEFGGNFSWPARQSENQTPFQMLLEKLAMLKDKPTCLQIIKFLIRRYPKIDMFQREKCATLIRQNFEELVNEYQVVESWKEVADKKMGWFLVNNEAKFLVMFDNLKNINSEELTKVIFNEDLLRLSIRHDRYESFVEIYKLVFKNINIQDVASDITFANCPRILKYFLDHDSVTNIHPGSMLDILNNMVDKEKEIDSKTLKCFHILLAHPKYNVNEPVFENNNITALQYAAKCEYAVKELLKNGASLIVRDNFGIMPIQTIEKNTLRNFLDSCITKCDAESVNTNDYYMVIDYSFLKVSKEMPPIEYMANSKDLQPLVEHPVIASFLLLKWLELSDLFYLNFIFFSFIATCFSTYLIQVYVPQDQQDSTNNGWFQITLQILAYLSLFFFYMKEFIQFLTKPMSYIKSVENYLEIGLMYLMAVALMLPLGDQQTRRTITAVVLLAFGIEWTLMLGALPIFSVSNYVVMLKKVAVNFLQTLSFYSIILLAFVLSFYTLLNQTEVSTGNSASSESNGINEADKSGESQPNKKLSMFSALFHVILMLTGDFERASEEGDTNIINRIFLLIFVLSMTIVMMNLLIGLTVSDTAAIQKEAELYKWLERVKYLGEFDRKINHWAPDLSLMMPKKLPLNKVKVEISSYDSYKWMFVPGKANSDDGAKNKNCENISKDIEGDPFPLLNVKEKAVHWSFFNYSLVPDEMDIQIIENGLEVLDRNQEIKAQKKLVMKNKELKRTKQEDRDEKRRTLSWLERQQQQMDIKIKKIGQNIEQMLKQM